MPTLTTYRGHDPSRLVTGAAEIPAAATPPGEIMLMPASAVLFRPHDGRAPVVNAAPDAVVAATMALRGESGTDLPVDYDHQSEYSWSGSLAPAAGWIDRVWVRDGAIWGSVTWTERAQRLISAREYRYISPVFLIDDERRVRCIIGAGLVNDPALFMRALARAGQETHMPYTPHTDDATTLAQVRAVLGLRPDADSATILAAASARPSSSHAGPAAHPALPAAQAPLPLAATAADPMRDALPPAPDPAHPARPFITADLPAPVRSAHTAAAGTRHLPPAPDAAAPAPALSDWVPRAEYDRVASALTQIQAAQTAAGAAAAVDAATKAGKLAPAQRAWGLDYAISDPAGFDVFVASAAALLPQGRVLPGAGDGAPGTLTPDEMAVCRATGVTPDAYREAAARMRGEEPPKRPAAPAAKEAR